MSELRNMTYEETQQERLYELMKQLSEKAVPVIEKESDAYFIFDAFDDAPDGWECTVNYEGQTYYLDPNDRYSYEGAKRAVEIQKAIGVDFTVPVDEYDCDCDKHEITCKSGDTPCECKKPCTCEREEMETIFEDHSGEDDMSRNCPVTGVPLNTALTDDGIERELDHFIGEDGKIKVERDITKSDDLYWIWRLANDAYYSRETFKQYGEKILAIAEFALTEYNFSNWLGDE